jgi:hypothetical protein
VLAAALAAGYLAVAPASSDLAAQLLRVKLFGAEGFGLWNNWWYAGHNVPGYSVLFPPLGWLLGAQLAGAVAAVGAAAAFEALAHERFGDRAWLGATWFGAATVTQLLSGRLTFTLGLFGAALCALALQRRRPGAACALAALAALASPVAALFAALAGAAYGLGDRERSPARRTLVAAAVVAAAFAPVGLLAIAFPEGGREPFAFSALWPIPVLAAGLALALPGRDRVLRAGVVVYGAGCVLAYALPTPVGGNAARLGVLVAGPLAALVLYPRRSRLLLLAAPALLYVQWQGAIRDVSQASGNASTTAAYYAPLLAFLEHRPGPPFRIEIPFTTTHWEAYEVAPSIPLARGWERQLDIADNRLFYGRGPLTAVRYDAWLHTLAVRYVALPDTALDASAGAEARLIESGLPYLRLVDRSRHWRVYAVVRATPIVSGTATLTALGPDWAALSADRAGRALVRIRWSPYWRLSGVPGCVSPVGNFTAVRFARPGRGRLVIAFSFGRVGSRSARCT